MQFERHGNTNSYLGAPCNCGTAGILRHEYIPCQTEEINLPSISRLCNVNNTGVRIISQDLAHLVANLRELESSYSGIIIGHFLNSLTEKEDCNKKQLSCHSFFRETSLNFQPFPFSLLRRQTRILVLQLNLIFG